MCVVSEPELTIYHDGSCPLCRKEIAHYRRQSGAERLAFVDVSAPDCQPGVGLDRQGALSRFHVRLPDGTLQSGAAGFVAVWQRLPAWRWAARLASVPGALPLLELGYRLFLPVRPRIASAVTWISRWTEGRRGSAPRRRS